MKNQLKMDGRVSPEALYERRKLIVNLYRNGMKVMAITKVVGMSWNAVRKTIDLYEAEGMKALKPKKRGRPTGTARTLTPEQEKQVQRDIRDKRPEQMKMDFALWTREAVLVYIREHFGIKMPVRTVGEYLKRWGFTPQKPIKVAYEQKPEAVKKWLDEHKEKIEVFYLPSYSPELNPDERLNADLKHAITTNVPKRTRQGLMKKKTQEHMAMVKSSPERVKTYFKDKHVAYAAEST